MNIHTKLTIEELNQWYMWRKQAVNGWHLSDSDLRELTRLNHLVMEASHEIHNNNMLENVNVAGTPHAFDKLFDSLPKKDQERQ